MNCLVDRRCDGCNGAHLVFPVTFGPSLIMLSSDLTLLGFMFRLGSDSADSVIHLDSGSKKALNDSSRKFE